MIIILENEKPISWNKYYSGMHWRQRQVEAHRVHNLIKYEAYQQIMKLSGKINKYTNPVDIIVTAYFLGNRQDADNIASKLYIDGLKGLLLEDDNPEFVRSVKAISEKTFGKPKITIQIDEVL